MLYQLKNSASVPNRHTSVVKCRDIQKIGLNAASVQKKRKVSQGWILKKQNMFFLDAYRIVNHEKSPQCSL